MNIIVGLSGRENGNTLQDNNLLMMNLYNFVYFHSA